MTITIKTTKEISIYALKDMMDAVEWGSSYSLKGLALLEAIHDVWGVTFEGNPQNIKNLWTEYDLSQPDSLERFVDDYATAVPSLSAKLSVKNKANKILERLRDLTLVLQDCQVVVVTNVRRIPFAWQR